MAFSKKGFFNLKNNWFFVGSCRTRIRITYYSWLPTASRGLMAAAKGNTVSWQSGVHNIIPIIHPCNIRMSLLYCTSRIPTISVRFERRTCNNNSI